MKAYEPQITLLLTNGSGLGGDLLNEKLYCTANTITIGGKIELKDVAVGCWMYICDLFSIYL